jgi:hypothetical protein
VVKWVAASDGGSTLNLFAAFSTGKVASYTLIDGRSLERRHAVNLGVPILSLVYTDSSLLLGCSDGGLRLIPIRQGGGGDGAAYFDGKPSVWPAVNHAGAPGISSISVVAASTTAVTTAAKPTTSTQQQQLICCTGGVDGSVSLFELKRA